jgi:hypothetical protein
MTEEKKIHLKHLTTAVKKYCCGNGKWGIGPDAIVIYFFSDI